MLGHFCAFLFAACIPFVVAASFPELAPSSTSTTNSTTKMAPVRSPYVPTAGWTYAIEAIRSSNWPACPYRFLSFPDSCDSVDLWRGAGSNQMWTLEAAPSSDPYVFYLRASCGSYLRCMFFFFKASLACTNLLVSYSYPSDCGIDKVSSNTTLKECMSPFI